jgi:hypothetical protein
MHLIYIKIYPINFPSSQQQVMEPAPDTHFGRYTKCSPLFLAKSGAFSLYMIRKIVYAKFGRFRATQQTSVKVMANMASCTSTDMYRCLNSLRVRINMYKILISSCL